MFGLKKLNPQKNRLFEAKTAKTSTFWIKTTNKVEIFDTKANKMHKPNKNTAL